MPLFETERLTIEKAQLSDSPFIFELLNSPGWLRFIGDRGIRTLQDATAYIHKGLIDSYRKNGFGLYKMVLKTENKPIGLCGFMKRDYLDSVDIGYAILPEYEGKGYMAEAAREMLKYGTSVLGFKTVYAITTPGNIRSKKLLEKIGLQLANSIKPDGQKEELLLFSY